MFAIIAGSGDLPLAVSGVLQERSTKFLLIDIVGNRSLSVCNASIYRTSPGQVGKILKILKKNKVTDVLFIGSLKRPSFKDLRFDLTGIWWYINIYKNMKKGDDKLLKTILNKLENKGFKIKSIPEITPELLSNPNDSVGSPSKQNLDDIEIGRKILGDLSKYDIGQAIVIQDGLTIGIEAIEGTDNLLKRTKEIKRNTKTGGVLVKLPKIGQTDYADLPTIGPDTIKNAKDSGLDGIAIKADKTIIVHKQKTLELAKNLGVFIKVIE